MLLHMKNHRAVYKLLIFCGNHKHTLCHLEIDFLEATRSKDGRLVVSSLPILLSYLVSSFGLYNSSMRHCLKNFQSVNDPRAAPSDVSQPQFPWRLLQHTWCTL